MKISPPDCITCVNASRDDGRRFYCAVFADYVPYHFIFTGCERHLYHPAFLVDFAEKLEVNLEAGVISYRNKITGNCFNNGIGGQNDYSSEEIHAAQDKRAIGNPDIEGLRGEFGGKISG